MLTLDINKNNFRVDEVAEYFSVTERTIRLWIKNGFLKSVGVKTRRRINREAILELRKRSRNYKIISKEKILKESLDNRIAAGIYRSIRKKDVKNEWELMLGFTVDELKIHLEKLFKPNMTWEKFINGEIHIDHKIPLSVFNFTSPDHIDFKRCWCLTNLQPLWAKENLKKGAKLKHPFQPSLLLVIK